MASKKKKKEKKQGFEITRVALDAVIAALVDFSKNRLSVPQLEAAYEAKQDVFEHLEAREGLRRELVLQYDESGEGWEDASKAPEELVSKIVEMQNGTVKLTFKSPIKVANLSDDVRIDGNHYALLKEIGFLV